MDPDQFRKNRVKINQLCEAVQTCADASDAEAAKKKLSQAETTLEELTPQAEGEIQERSVKNLGIKINAAIGIIAKIKPPKRPRRAKAVAPGEIIEWTEKRLSSLSETYLSNVFENMKSDETSQVCFSTSGKGVRSSYQVSFEKGSSISFSGSSHKPLKRKLPTSAQKISKPFSLSTIKSIVDGK